MLVLDRLKGQKLIIEVPPSTEVTRVEILVEAVRGMRARLGVIAPKSTRIDREEIYLERKRLGAKVDS